jgi:hypothetical protein
MEGKAVSVKSACALAGVDRANLRKKYPDAVNAIKKLAAPIRPTRRSAPDRRTGILGVIDDDVDRDDN